MPHSSTSPARQLAVVGAGALVAGSVVIIAIWMSALAVEKMDRRMPEPVETLSIEHTPDGAGKDSGVVVHPVATVTPSPTVITTAPDEIAESEDFGSLPPCAAEDSTGCYWDASEQGNGTGNDVITPAEPEPVTPNTGARQDYDTGVLECGVNAAPAIDQDEYGNWWAYCEPALVTD